MKIMIFSSSPLFTGGYGVIADNMGKELIRKGVDVAWVGIEYGSGQPIEYAGGKIYAGGDMMKWGQEIMEFRPDVLFHIRDNWVFTNMYNGKPYTFKKLWEYGIKQVNYTPVQAIPLPDVFVRSVESEAHLTLISNKWGRDYLIKDEGISADKVEYLYHGVDRTVFNYSESGKHEGKRFIFVGTNFDIRKNIPFILKAYKEYRERSGDNESKLYLHTNLVGSIDLAWIIKSLGFEIGREIIMKDVQAVGIEGGLPSGKLAEWYNWADCYITGTMSEGFNIPLLEAMSVGLSAVVTDFPVHREVFSRFDRVKFVKSYNEMPTSWGIEWVADLDDFVDGMIKCEGKKPRGNELFREFSWGAIVDRFLKLLDERLNL